MCTIIFFAQRTMFLYLDKEDVLSYYGAVSLYTFLGLSGTLSQFCLMVNHRGLIICFNAFIKMDHEFRTYGREIRYLLLLKCTILYILILLLIPLLIGRFPVDTIEAINIFLGYYYPIYIRSAVFGIGIIIVMVMYWHYFLLEE